ncbi:MULTISPECIES: lysostaphin resistance A-like protein [unclassified Carboxylicivirga]|uniref:CPBP family intramembrane glutamic endopeptidase n=1 Tax=Carboxylicivirga TaxID=1628153 RepID=UPI003D3320EA
MIHLESAYKGENEWWKYLLLIAISLLGGQIIGGVFMMIILAVLSASGGGTLTAEALSSMDFAAMGVHPTVGLVLLMLPFLISLLLLVVFFKPLHRRVFTSVINGWQKVRWQRVITGYGVWALIMAFFLVVDYYMNIDNYELRLNWGALIPLALVSLVLIPFQSFYEEILFRGYLAQGVGRITHSRWMVIIIPSVFFALLHSMNPEIEKFGFWTMMPQYFMIGAVYALLSVLDDGIELAMGAHAANNTFISIFVTADGMAFQTDALLKAQEIDPSKEFVTMLIGSVIFVGALAFRYKWSWRVLSKPVEAPEDSSLVA